MFKKSLFALSLSLLFVPLPAPAEEPVDWDMVSRIRDEGFNRSQVMETVIEMTDVIGPRLTGSPQMKQANDWTLAKLQEWGLENGHLESFEFGRGWSFSRAAVHMVEPHQVPLLALPKAWTRGTKKSVTGEVMEFKVESVEDLEEYRGKVKGKILLVKPNERRGGPPGRPTDDDPPPKRYSEEALDDISHFEIPTGEGNAWRRMLGMRMKLRKAVREFLSEEKAIATIEISSRKNGVIRVAGGGSREPDENPGVLGLVMSVEHFKRIQRMLAEDRTVKLEIDVRAKFHDDDLNAYNTIAEIPGTDGSGEIVMAGAHLDSWHTGTGATDNGAPSAVMMEAMRILKALDVRPKRTIRIALWSGEEQGLLGSRAYVTEHFASRPEAPKGDPAARWKTRWPLTLKPDHAKLSAYFNLDNGGGRIRGVWGQENTAVQPIFSAWLEPFEDLGATAMTQRNTGGTDHQSFDREGLPGFQFIQDQMDYFARTHHTNLDVLEALEEEDLKQASVIVASFLYHAAMRDELLPRKPLPQEPTEDEKKRRKKAEGSDGHDHGH